MPNNAKVLDIDSVVPDDSREHLSKMLGREKLVAATRRERTDNAYAELLRADGFRFTRIIPIAGPMSIVEGETA